MYIPVKRVLISLPCSLQVTPKRSDSHDRQTGRRHTGNATWWPSGGILFLKWNDTGISGGDADAFSSGPSHRRCWWSGENRGRTARPSSTPRWDSGDWIGCRRLKRDDHKIIVDVSTQHLNIEDTWICIVECVFNNYCVDVHYYTAGRYV